MKITVNNAPRNGKNHRRPPMSPGKAAWLQRKAERAKKRAEENKELERVGTLKTRHMDNDAVRHLKGHELIAALDNAILAAHDLKATIDHHGNSTCVDLVAYKRELERRARKYGWKPIDGDTTFTSARDFMLDFYNKKDQANRAAAAS